MKVAPAVSNKKIPRKIVFHCREPPWMFVQRQNALVAISFPFLLFVY